MSQSKCDVMNCNSKNSSVTDYSKYTLNNMFIKLEKNHATTISFIVTKTDTIESMDDVSIVEMETCYINRNNISSINTYIASECQQYSIYMNNGNIYTVNINCEDVSEKEYYDAVYAVRSALGLGDY